MMNFKKFLIEETIPGAMTYTQGAKNHTGEEGLPDLNLDFPTFTKTGRVSHEPFIRGQNYIIRLENGAELIVNRKKWGKKRLPQIGESLIATWYQFSDGRNYSLKSLDFAHGS